MAVLQTVQKAAKAIGETTISAAKNAKKVTQDMLTVRRLHKRVALAYDKIDDLKETIATYIWSKYASGQPLDPQETAYCLEIQKAKQSIGQMLAQIDAIHANKLPQLHISSEIDWICVDCGAQNPAGTRFCGGCGKCIIE